MYTRSKIAGVTLNALMMDFVTSTAFMKLSRQSIASHYIGVFFKRRDRIPAHSTLRRGGSAPTCDDLKQLWSFRQRDAALEFWNSRYARAVASGIKPLIAFAEMLAGKIDGILSHCGYPLHTGLLEGINNKIKVIKRMAYGFRYDEYFFLKIRAAFPGIAG
jgi:hypothetical protein